jgi:hypothetical protein
MPHTNRGAMILALCFQQPRIDRRLAQRAVSQVGYPPIDTVSAFRQRSAGRRLSLV